MKNPTTTALERERARILAARKKEVLAFIVRKGLTVKSRVRPLSERFMANGEVDCWMEVPIPTALDARRKVWNAEYAKAHKNAVNDRMLACCLDYVRQLDGHGWDKIMDELTKDGSFHG